jgi:hypothetical protein
MPGNLRVKYQPYKGYGHKPWLSYREPHYPLRIKTKHDWRWRCVLPHHQINHEYVHYCRKPPLPTPPAFCRRCGRVHCYDCGCWKPWKKHDKNSNASNYEKQLVHRAFRRAVKDAIRRELDGDDAISHNFFVSGDWLD